MKKQLLKKNIFNSSNKAAIALLCFFFAIQSQLISQITQPVWNFATGAGNGTWEHGMAIKTQGTDVYAFCRYSGSPNISGVSPAFNGGSAACVVRLNATTGAGVWAAGNQGTTTDTYAWGFSIDGLGNSYAGGTTNSCCTGYLSKTNSVGTILWRKSCTPLGGVDATVSDANGVWATGGGNATVTATGIVHCDGSGNFRYNPSCMTATTYMVGKGLALWNGFIYVCGGYWGTPTFAPMFGAGAPMTGPASGAYGTYYVARYDTTTGTCTQVITFQNAGLDNSGWYEQNDIALDAAGNIYCSSHFQGTATFGATSLTSAGSNDIWVAKLNNAGVVQWVTASGGTGSDEPCALALDNQGNVYTAGYYTGTCTFDMLTGCQTLTTVAGGTHINGCIIKYDNATGQIQWVKGASAAMDCQFYGVAVDNNNNVWATGSYSDNASATFDAITIPGYTTGGDIFIARLDQSPTKGIIPVVSKSPYASGSSYTLPYLLKPGSTFTGGNVFTAEISDAAGNFPGTNIGNVTSTTAGNISISLPCLAAGTYKIRIKSTSPVDVSDAYCVKITSAVVFAASASPGNICAGGSSTLSCSAGSSGWVWAPGATLSATNVASPVASPAATTTYTVTATVGACPSISATVTVNVDVPRAISLNGSSQYYEVPNSASLRAGAGDFTYEIWVRPTSYTSQNTYFENGNWNSSNTLILRQDASTGTNQMGVHINGASQTWFTYAPPLNTWTLLSLARSGGTMYLYANGTQLIGTIAYAGALNPTDVLRIGSSVHTTGQYFIGQLDEFRFWNYYRSPATIAAEMHTGISSAHANWSNLKCYLKFNEASGVSFDRSSNTNNASPIGSPSVVTLYPAGISISGTSIPCLGAPTNYTVSMTNIYSRLVTYNWAVTGGAINSGQGTNTVNVTFSSGGAQTISLNGGTIQHSDECQTESVTPLSVTANAAGLNGTYTINNLVATNWPSTGTNFNNFRDAISALTCQTGPVTFNVSAGQTFNESNMIINASGNWNIIFQKSGGGANPKLVAGTTAPNVGIGTTDAFIIIQGTDKVTFDAIDLQENAANVTSTTKMEWGYALFKNSVTDGAQNCVIKNCVITLDKTNANTTIGIYSENVTPSAPISQLACTNATGANSNNEFYGNTINTTYYPIYINGDPTYYDQNVKIGKTGMTVNTIANWGGANSIAAYGIFAQYQNGLSITNNNLTGGSNNTTTYGIYTVNGTNSNLDVYANTISGTTVTGVCYSIYNNIGLTGTNNTVNIYNNTVSNISNNSTAYAMYNNVGATNYNIYGNTVSGTSSTLGLNAAIIVIGSSVNPIMVYNNTVVNCTAPSYYAMRLQPTSALTAYGNSIHGNTSTTGFMYGLYCVNISTGIIYNNTIYSNITNTAAASPNFGITIITGTNYTIHNNMVSDLRATTSTYDPAIAGINIGTPSGTIGMYNNSIYLNATGPATFNTAGIYVTSTPTSVILKNNIVVNTSSPGTGKAVAYRRADNITTNFVNGASNNNLYYVGAGVNNFIYFDGTATDQTLANYKLRWSATGAQESASYNDNPGLLSSTDLHQTNMSNTAAVTQRGLSIAGLVSDIDGDPRSATPDLGYDEYTVVLPIELLSFTGKDQGKTNLVEWSTASEKNNAYFTIERSFDAQTFEFVGKVNANTNSTSVNNYSLVDENPYQYTYYRLKQTDLNGTTSTSKIILVTKGEGLNIVNVYPNPASADFQFTVSSSEDTQVKVKVVDILGKELIVQPKVDLVKGMNHLTLDASTLSKGSYFIQVETTTGEFFRTQKKLMTK